jgi:hypothetical protein
MRIIALIMITGGGLLASTRPAGGQEVDSDVNIPMPREIVTTIPAVSGLFATPVITQELAIQGVLVEAEVGTLNEAAARVELGDFMTSLLIKAGLITVEPQPIRVATFGEQSEEGARPAWTGRTPMALSMSRTRRSGAVRGR